jgi:hypothetical protein
MPNEPLPISSNSLTLSLGTSHSLEKQAVQKHAQKQYLFIVVNQFKVEMKVMI